MLPEHLRGESFPRHGQTGTFVHDQSGERTSDQRKHGKYGKPMDWSVRNRAPII